MPRTSHSSCPSIIIGDLRSFFCPGRGFISAFLRRSACSISWILTCGRSSSRYECPICSKILNGPAACRLSLGLSRFICQPLRNT